MRNVWFVIVGFIVSSAPADQMDESLYASAQRRMSDRKSKLLPMYAVTAGEEGIVKLKTPREKSEYEAGRIDSQGACVWAPGIGWCADCNVPISEGTVFINVGDEGTVIRIGSVVLQKGEMAVFAEGRVEKQDSDEPKSTEPAPASAAKKEPPGSKKPKPKASSAVPAKRAGAAAPERKQTKRPVLPPLRGSLLGGGRNQLTIVNNSDQAARIGLRIDNLSVAAHGKSRTLSLPDGTYKVFMVFNGDDQLLQGDDLTLHNNISTLTIGTDVGNYNFRAAP